jgi:hypothetical protein
MFDLIRQVYYCRLNGFPPNRITNHRAETTGLMREAAELQLEYDQLRS